MSCLQWLVAVALLVSCLGSSSLATARSATASQSPQAQTTTQPSDKLNFFWKDLAIVHHIYTQCANEHMSVCLKKKLVTALDRSLRKMKTVKLLDGVQFVKNSETEAGGGDQRAQPLNEKELESVLPRSLEARESVLNNMIFKKLIAFLQDHTLQVKFPDWQADNEATGDNSVEGRGRKKDKKGGGAYIMIPLLLGGTFVPIAYGALAMLAGKALIVSKLALVLASIIGIKKLLSGGGKESSHEVVVSSGSHSGWGRDFDLAYSGWKPAFTEPIKAI